MPKSLSIWALSNSSCYTCLTVGCPQNRQLCFLFPQFSDLMENKCFGGLCCIFLLYWNCGVTPYVITHWIDWILILSDGWKKWKVVNSILSLGAFHSIYSESTPSDRRDLSKFWLFIYLTAYGRTNLIRSYQHDDVLTVLQNHCLTLDWFIYLEISFALFPYRFWIILDFQKFEIKKPQPLLFFAIYLLSSTNGTFSFWKHQSLKSKFNYLLTKELVHLLPLFSYIHQYKWNMFSFNRWRIYCLVA